jgi:hypothetical protein
VRRVGHDHAVGAYLHAMRELIRAHQRPSVLIRGNQSSSEAIRAHQRQSELIRGNQSSSARHGHTPVPRRR